MLNTDNSELANTDSFIEPLKKAKAVWIAGGRQGGWWMFYLGTKVERELHALLGRGGVIGGSFRRGNRSGVVSRPGVQVG